MQLSEATTVYSEAIRKGTHPFLQSFLMQEAARTGPKKISNTRKVDSQKETASRSVGACSEFVDNNITIGKCYLIIELAKCKLIFLDLNDRLGVPEKMQQLLGPSPRPRGRCRPPQKSCWQWKGVCRSRARLARLSFTTLES